MKSGASILTGLALALIECLSRLGSSYLALTSNLVPCYVEKTEVSSAHASNVDGTCAYTSTR